MLVAGGDTGGKLGGIINLATSTVSSASSQIFNTATNTFLLVGSLNTARESAAAVALPNNLTLIAGGETCSAMTYGGVAGFQCNALNTAELYNETTKAFTFAGSGSGGVMTVARSGPSATLISGSGTALDGQVLIVGGSTGSSFLGLSVPPPSTGAPSGQSALHTAELYNPTTDAFTATTGSIPGCAAGVSSCAAGIASICGGPSAAITAASESGTTVTITSAVTGILVGNNVVIAGVTPAGYSGTFAVTGTGSGTFTYTAASGLGTATLASATAVADTFECGMVDQGAALIPNDGGKVLLAGGDLVEFLGESSNFSFIFDPTTQTFTKTTGTLTTPRELFALVAMDPSVVTGALSGDVVAFGGIEANSAVCTNPADPVVATTLNTAEVFNPSSQTWSAAANTMGAKRAGVATLIKTGADAGEVILPGGVDVEAGTFPSTCTATTSLKQGATAETDLYAPDTGTGGTFTATGSLNAAREGAGQGVLGTGTDETDVLIAGGACTTASPSLQSVVIGSAQATTTCGGAQYTNDYSELYSQGTGTWAVGPTFASGFSPTNGAASAVLP